MSAILIQMLPLLVFILVETVPVLKKMVLGISLYTFFHIGAVCYTAYFSSRKMWAIVSGPGYFFSSQLWWF